MKALFKIKMISRVTSVDIQFDDAPAFASCLFDRKINQCFAKALTLYPRHDIKLFDPKFVLKSFERNKALAYTSLFQNIEELAIDHTLGQCFRCIAFIKHKIDLIL